MAAVARRTNDHAFGVAWNWQGDQDFVHLLDQACIQTGLSCYLVGHHNLAQTLREVHNDERQFRWFLDRASDEDQRFLELNRLLQQKGTCFLNAHHHYQRSIDKANIHGELLARGLPVPLTVVLPPLAAAPHVDPCLIAPVPTPFVVKPARGGGGAGVVVGATRLEEVVHARARFSNQRYLVQQRVVPQLIAGRRAWFRVYHVCGEILHCWWDDITHRYTLFTPADARLVNTAELDRIVQIVAHVAQLDFFSTEIALHNDGRYVLVDYVNDPCDMRLQSKHFDGVPDSIVRRIIQCIVAYLHRQLAPSKTTDTADAHLWP